MTKSFLRLNIGAIVQLAAFVMVLAALPAPSQEHSVHSKTFAGSFDSEYPYPSIEGKPGEKDASAVAIINQFVAYVSLPDGAAIDASGTMTLGSGRSSNDLPTSLVLESNNFRMDVDHGDAVRSVRIAGFRGSARRGGDSIEQINDADFSDPFAIPIQLGAISQRADAAVVDDGVIAFGQTRLDRITITLYQAHTGSPLAASFYFDPDTHILEKAALVGHSATNESQTYLKIVTYSNYKRVESVALPQDFLETFDGQRMATLHLSSVAVSSSHAESYFTFER